MWRGLGAILPFILFRKNQGAFEIQNFMHSKCLFSYGQKSDLPEED